MKGYKMSIFMTGFDYFLNTIKRLLNRGLDTNDIDKAAIYYSQNDPLIKSCEDAVKSALDIDIQLVNDNTPVEARTLFTEADIEDAKREAKREATFEARTAFAAIDAKREKDAFSRQILEFCQAGVESGKIRRSWIDSGLVEFMEQLPHNQSSSISFSEHEERMTTAEWFKNWLDGLQSLIPTQTQRQNNDSTN
jgi:hypothetical protein